MKRGFAWLLTLLALLGLLSGCGGGDTAAADTATSADTADNGTAASGGSYGAWAETEVAEDSGQAEDGASDRLENAKMIYTARMEVETTAFGAAALAGLAAGVWSSLEEVAALRRSQHVFLPQRPQAACEAQYRQWRRAVDRALRWIENDV